MESLGLVGGHVTGPNHSDASKDSWAEPVTSTNHQAEVPQEALGDPEHSWFQNIIFDMLLDKHIGIETELDLGFFAALLQINSKVVS